MKAVVYTYTAKPNVLSRHRQRAECVDAAESAGHEVIAWLHDEAGNRTNLDRLCTGFKRGRFEAVFIHDWSRLGRSISEFQTVTAALQDAEVRLISCKEPVLARFLNNVLSEVPVSQSTIADAP